MKDCCKFWIGLRDEYKNYIHTHSEINRISPFVSRMQKIKGCPECLIEFQDRRKRKGIKHE